MGSQGEQRTANREREKIRRKRTLAFRGGIVLTQILVKNEWRGAC